MLTQCLKPGRALHLVEPCALKHHVRGIYPVLDLMFRHKHWFPAERSLGDYWFVRVCAALREAAERPSTPLVTAAFLAAADRREGLRREAAFVA
jgi:hypothetical protein